MPTIPLPALATRRSWAKTGVALTATRVADWQTVRVFLGQEWTRHQPDRRATFSSGGRRSTVTAIKFGVPDSLSYRLQADDRLRRVDFNALTVL